MMSNDWNLKKTPLGECNNPSWIKLNFVRRFKVELECFLILQHLFLCLGRGKRADRFTQGFSTLPL